MTFNRLAKEHTLKNNATDLHVTSFSENFIFTLVAIITGGRESPPTVDVNLIKLAASHSDHQIA